MGSEKNGDILGERRRIPHAPKMKPPRPARKEARELTVPEAKQIRTIQDKLSRLKEVGDSPEKMLVASMIIADVPFLLDLIEDLSDGGWRHERPESD